MSLFHSKNRHLWRRFKRFVEGDRKSGKASEDAKLPGARNDPDAVPRSTSVFGNGATTEEKQKVRDERSQANERLRTLLSAMSIPSLSSSPWRGAPH